MIVVDGGPFDLILGIPVHPLVVHAVVVLVPLAALGVFAMALSPKFSRQYGWLVALAAAGGAVSSLVAKEAGETLAERIGNPGFNHDKLGSTMPYFAMALFVLTVTLWLLDRPGPGRRGRLPVSVLALAVAVGSLVWVIRVGHTGAESVWSGVADITSMAGD